MHCPEIVLQTPVERLMVDILALIHQFPLWLSSHHHISLLSKVKDEAERAYYISETAQNGWSRDVMMLQIDNGYIHTKGRAINNFIQTLPPP